MLLIVFFKCCIFPLLVVLVLLYFNLSSEVKKVLWGVNLVEMSGCTYLPLWLRFCIFIVPNTILSIHIINEEACLIFQKINETNARSAKKLY